MIGALFSIIFCHAPETIRFPIIRCGAAGATVQRGCNGGALHPMALDTLGVLAIATVQR
ncbi:MAG: hypothetical protein PSY14_06780 [bacterium]|nr:hypothetical protein [bacterium]